MRGGPILKLKEQKFMRHRNLSKRLSSEVRSVVDGGDDSRLREYVFEVEECQLGETIFDQELLEDLLRLLADRATHSTGVPSVLIEPLRFDANKLTRDQRRQVIEVLG